MHYCVSGPFPYRGHEPGSTFKADSDDATERAVARGSITSVKADKPTPAPTSTSTSTPAPTPAKPSGAADPKPKEGNQ